MQAAQQLCHQQPHPASEQLQALTGPSSTLTHTLTHWCRRHCRLADSVFHWRLDSSAFLLPSVAAWLERQQQQQNQTQQWIRGGPVLLPCWKISHHANKEKEVTCESDSIQTHWQRFPWWNVTVSQQRQQQQASSAAAAAAAAVFRERRLAGFTLCHWIRAPIRFQKWRNLFPKQSGKNSDRLVAISC